MATLDPITVETAAMSFHQKWTLWVSQNPALQKSMKIYHYNSDFRSIAAHAEDRMRATRTDLHL
ncbi:hypothetical protein [Shinella sp. BYT-45]|uniref:hypothetical protein n=1 Tax=Shinella sp. BYT-45 TaxID=3377377 RepID=UPI00397EE004